MDRDWHPSQTFIQRPDGRMGMRLIALRQSGWKLALCSASRNARTICARLEILDLFDTVVDGNSVTQN